MSLLRLAALMRMLKFASKMWVTLTTAPHSILTLYCQGRGVVSLGGGEGGRATGWKNEWHVHVKLRSVVGERKKRKERERERESERERGGWKQQPAKEKVLLPVPGAQGREEGGGERERAACWLLIGPAHNTPHGRANDAPDAAL